MSLTTDDIEKLVEKGRGLQREQDRVEAQIEAKQEEYDALVADLKSAHGLTPEELPAAIAKAEDGLRKIADGAGLGDMLPQKAEAEPVTVDLVAIGDTIPMEPAELLEGAHDMVHREPAPELDIEESLDDLLADI